MIEGQLVHPTLLEEVVHGSLIIRIGAWLQDGALDGTGGLREFREWA